MSLSLLRFFLSGPIFEDIQIYWMALHSSQKLVIAAVMGVVVTYAILIIGVRLRFSWVLGGMHLISVIGAYLLLSREMPSSLAVDGFFINL